MLLPFQRDSQCLGQSGEVVFWMHLKNNYKSVIIESDKFSIGAISLRFV